VDPARTEFDQQLLYLVAKIASHLSRSSRMVNIACMSR
jgi:hypothetical protein